MSLFLRKKGSFLEYVLEVVKKGVFFKDEMSAISCEKGGQISKIVLETPLNRGVFRTPGTIMCYPSEYEENPPGLKHVSSTVLNFWFQN